MKKFMLTVSLLLAVLLSGCGGSKSSSTNTTTVTISPLSTSLLPSQTQQFTATVTNNSNTNVTWQVDGVTGGSSSTGTISTAGLYTAPSTVSATVTHTITAVSQADSTKTATGSVVLTPPPPPYVPGIVVSPASATLPAGAQQTFAATVNGAPATVTWTVNCSSTAAGACGTIDASGAYIAPLAPPAGGGITVTATSSNASANPGNASVTVQYSNQSLVGQYAFSFIGESNSSAYLALAGSIKLDGQGNVTGGEEDVTGTAGPTAITGGTYHLGTDGRGNATVTTASGSMTWQFSMLNHVHADAVIFSSTVIASGTLDLQDATQFASSSVSGAYAFQMTGASGTSPANTLHRVGEITANGAGSVTSGLMDQNDNGTVSSATAISGTYTAPDTNGRGVLTLTGMASVPFYVIDATRFKLLDANLATPAAGEATKQAAGPFSAASLKGTLATVMLGANSSGPVGKGALFSMDGASAVSGTVDLNTDGNVPFGGAGTSVTGTYTVADATTGRTTITWSEAGTSHTFALYPASNVDYMAEMDSMPVGGAALAQQQIGFSNASISGAFVTRSRGFAFLPTPGPIAFSGLISPSGGSAASGTLDINVGGTTTASAAMTGSYIMGSNGRAAFNTASSSAALPSSTFIWYTLDANRVLYLETDGNRVMTGFMQKRQ